MHDQAYYHYQSGPVKHLSVNMFYTDLGHRLEDAADIGHQFVMGRQYVTDAAHLRLHSILKHNQSNSITTVIHSQ